MPVNLEFRFDGQLMYWEFHDPWALEDAVQCLRRVTEHIDSTPEAVYSFVDLRSIRHIPKGILQIPKLAKWHVPNGREVILVTKSQAIKSLVQLIFRLARSERAVFFQDYEQAWAYTEQLVSSKVKTGKFKSVPDIQIGKDK